MPSSIDEERNESEKCDNAYAAKQDVKEINSILNPDQWKKGTTFIVRDSMFAGLREPQLSEVKKIKPAIFQVEKLKIYDKI